ncbi:MAG TPA: glucosaminidase domain-containing protein [Ktedonobacteraceae bacterium]
MLYAPYPQRRTGCFTPFGCGLVVIGILIGVILVVYPNSPFRPKSLPNPFAQPTPAHHSKPDVRVLSAALGHGQDVRGIPTLSANFVNRVLVAAHSPAQGTGPALYDLSQHYGIDDAYALAFFEHESQFGTTGMAQRTHSLGNIRCSTGYQCTSGYRAYSSWVAGYADWYQLIHSLYINTWHLTTVEQIIPVYAPAGDGNDVPGYIAAIEQAVAHWHHGEV